MIRCTGWSHTDCRPARHHEETKRLAAEAIPESRGGDCPAAPTVRLRWVAQVNVSVPQDPAVIPDAGCVAFPCSLSTNLFTYLRGLCSLKPEATDEGGRYWEGLLCLAPLDFDLVHLLLSLAFSGGFPDNFSSLQEQTSWCNELNLFRYFSTEELIELNTIKPDVYIHPQTYIFSTSKRSLHIGRGNCFLDVYTTNLDSCNTISQCSLLTMEHSPPSQDTRTSKQESLECLLMTFPPMIYSSKPVKQLLT